MNFLYSFSFIQACLEKGINFFDTAEIYGFGLSEEFLRDFMRYNKSSPIIATKFAVLPWRYSCILTTLKKKKN